MNDDKWEEQDFGVVTKRNTLLSIERLEMLIKGNKEVLNIVRNFPSETELAISLRDTISGQKKILKNLKKLLTELKKKEKEDGLK